MYWLVGIGQSELETLKIKADSFDEAVKFARELDLRYCSGKVYDFEEDQLKTYREI